MTDEELIARLRKGPSMLAQEEAADRIEALRQAVQHANDHADAAIADMQAQGRKLEQETRRRQSMTDTAFDWKARAERLEAALRDVQRYGVITHTALALLTQKDRTDG